MYVRRIALTNKLFTFSIYLTWSLFSLRVIPTDSNIQQYAEGDYSQITMTTVAKMTRKIPSKKSKQYKNNEANKGMQTPLIWEALRIKSKNVTARIVHLYEYNV